MLEVIQQLLKFMRVHRKYWLFPVFFGLIILGGLVMLAAQGSAVAPFIYAIF
jgi:hypothetical protein